MKLTGGVFTALASRASRWSSCYPRAVLPTLDFWFDYTCPYAYLASTQVEALAGRTGARLVYRPMLLGGVFGV